MTRLIEGTRVRYKESWIDLCNPIESRGLISTMRVRAARGTVTEVLDWTVVIVQWDDGHLGAISMIHVQPLSPIEQLAEAAE